MSNWFKAIGIFMVVVLCAVGLVVAMYLSYVLAVGLAVLGVILLIKTTLDTANKAT